MIWGWMSERREGGGANGNDGGKLLGIQNMLTQQEAIDDAIGLYFKPLDTGEYNKQDASGVSALPLDY